MLHAGLDLSRNRLDVCLLSDEGEIVEEFKSPADLDGLIGLVRRVDRRREPVRAVVESMTGALFVHDTLERLGWDVLIADAQKAKGLAPFTCKTDKTDARVLAVLSERRLVPEIWLPDPSIRAERELARFRLHLVKHRSALKNRIHSRLDQLRYAVPGDRPVRDRGLRPSAAARLARALAPDGRRGAAHDRRDRPPDRRAGQRAALGRRRPPLRAAAVDRAGDRLGARLHDRRRDRRHRALRKPEQADRLLRTLPTRDSVGRPGPPRPLDQARPEIPALGAARGDDARAAPSRLLRALPAQPSAGSASSAGAKVA